MNEAIQATRNELRYALCTDCMRPPAFRTECGDDGEWPEWWPAFVERLQAWTKACQEMKTLPKFGFAETLAFFVARGAQNPASREMSWRHILMELTSLNEFADLGTAFTNPRRIDEDEFGLVFAADPNTTTVEIARQITADYEAQAQRAVGLARNDRADRINSVHSVINEITRDAYIARTSSGIPRTVSPIQLPTELTGRSPAPVSKAHSGLSVPMDTGLSSVANQDAGVTVDPAVDVDGDRVMERTGSTIIGAMTSLVATVTGRGRRRMPLKKRRSSKAIRPKHKGGPNGLGRRTKKKTKRRSRPKLRGKSLDSSSETGEDSDKQGDDEENSNDEEKSNDEEISCVLDKDVEDTKELEEKDAEAPPVVATTTAKGALESRMANETFFSRRDATRGIYEFRSAMDHDMIHSYRMKDKTGPATGVALMMAPMEAPPYDVQAIAVMFNLDAFTDGTARAFWEENQERIMAIKQ
uniref:Uncharacterized protein n=1 Tax=Phaeomonas parva TaxID=124430 RepID=A0A7S1UDM8_9STRA|mmetsp:Transcript_43025/g.135015  ORF Transcript_43025/g.135015 Transcript_43025/m.135015 type:complete len:471 (+) Transcript_43025:257-1669(+)